MNQRIPEVIEYRYEKVATKDLKPPRDPDEPIDPSELSVTDGRTVKIRKDEAESLHHEIQDAIEARRSEGHRITHLVLGAEEFTTLDTYWRYVTEKNSHGAEQTGAEANLPVEELTVVSGSMIEPVVPAEVAREEHLFGDED